MAMASCLQWHQRNGNTARNRLSGNQYHAANLTASGLQPALASAGNAGGGCFGLISKAGVAKASWLAAISGESWRRGAHQSCGLRQSGTAES